MAVAVDSLVIGAVVLVELAALAYLAFSIYTTSAKIERVKEKIKGIPVKKNSRTKSNRTKSSRTKSRNNSKESKSKKNRKKGGRGDHFDEVADLGEVRPFPMPEATHPRIRVQRMADPESLVECADQLTSFIKSYKDKVASYPVSCGQSLYPSSTHSTLSDVLPGFLAHRLPSHPPEKRDKFADVLCDFRELILPGVGHFSPPGNRREFQLTHWQHPRFLVPQMAGPCIPDSMAEVILSQMSTIGFSWDSSPACNELDVVMTNWAGRALGIPEHFLFQGNTEFSPGGGTITVSLLFSPSYKCFRSR